MRKIYLLLVFTVLGCSTSTSKHDAKLTPETENAIALCSSHFSKEQSAFLEANYKEHMGSIGGKATTSSKGLVINQEGMDSADKVKLMEMYLKCIESHQEKKK
ncbi:hypothetical protein ACRRS0_05040 [Agarivorans sp. QJM3NY_29]|uniref:hypothetical protein n=1 Tax=unclassified Agarivorans TaxID=2636026 RepID=UPI003D7E5110